MTMTETAARAVDELGAAFLAGDRDAVLALFADSGEVLYAGSEPGEVAAGRSALRALLDRLFARDERYCWRATSTVVAEEDGRLYVVADCDLTVHPVGPDQSAGPATELVAYRIGGALERHGTSWLWRLCQGSEPSAG